MIGRKAAALAVCLFLSVNVLGGCGDVYLEPYQVEYEEYDELYRNLYRQPGMAAGRCVIDDESIYDAEEINAAAAGLFCLDKETILYSKNAFQSLPPASLTKLMTALITLEHADLSRSVTVGEEVLITEPGAKLCYFQPGDTLTVDQLLRASLIYSGNDAAAALAVAVGGSVENFVKMMNEEADRLGATSTHFKNPHGLDTEGHLTTVYDLYLIFSECLKYDAFLQIISAASYDCTYQKADGTSKTVTWMSTNEYLTGEKELPSGVNLYGGKTGTTELAGCCLMLYASDEAGRTYISVVLGAADGDTLYDEMNKLLIKIAE
ncbi:MAG TPA: D-alanyl-D-alanine carboxypeptidase [Candidatus Fimimorpha excrementavium]|nr:D-alanyl-D-alanine carboxypeptidase [Candidatus Fimimorpha excrementavium]